MLNFVVVMCGDAQPKKTTIGTKWREQKLVVSHVETVDKSPVIPASTRNLTEGNAEPAAHHWIPAFAGMTGLSTRFSYPARSSIQTVRRPDICAERA